VLILVPDGGYPCTLYIDRETYLLSMMEIETLTGTVEQKFTDYRDTGGVMMPWRTVTTQKAVGQTLEVTTTDVELNGEVDPAVFLPPGGLVEDFSITSGADSASIEFFYVNRHIYLPVRLESGGPERLFLLDSGAGMTMIDEKLSTAMGLEIGGTIPGAGAGGMTDFSMTRIPRFRTGDIEFEEQTAIIYPVSELTGRYSGIETGGILGYDFLSRFVTRIDYEKSRITFFRPGSQPAGGGDTIQAPLVHKIFSVTAVIGDEEGELGDEVGQGFEGLFLLDTGANSSVLQKSFTDAFGLLEGRKTVEIVVAGAGGEDRAAVARFGSLRIGNTVIRGPVLTVPLGGKGIGAFEGIAGVVGNDILERFTVWLDYANQIAVLEPNSSSEEPVWPDLSGIQLALDDDGAIAVRLVIPDSPASKAGMLAGDVLLRAGGVDATEDSIAEILSLLRGGGGHTVELEFMRDGEKRSATLDLEPYI
jgi:predicted aspartyl protease